MNANQCIHWTGLTGRGVCAAGVNYRELDYNSREPGLFLRLPCTAITRAGVPKRECPKRQLPTPEQLEAHERETKAWVDRVMRRINMLQPIRDAHPKGGSGVTECPECKGRLYWSIASNGHMHGKCETVGCLSWME